MKNLLEQEAEALRTKELFVLGAAEAWYKAYLGKSITLARDANALLGDAVAKYLGKKKRERPGEKDQ